MTNRAGVFVALAVALSGCGPTPVREESVIRAPWAVYVYLAADAPDLGARVAPVLERLRRGSEAGISVRVELDEFASDGHVRWRLERGASVVAARLPERTNGVESSLAEFLAWAREDAPAERVIVVVWGHGLGFRAPSDPPEVGGLALDANPPGRLDTPGLLRALAAAGPIDLFVADACLMQSLEAAIPLADSARYLVGSEQIEAYQGLPYDTFLPLLRAPPADERCPESDAVCRAAAALPGLQAKAVEATDAGNHATLSVLDGAALKQLVTPARAAWAHAMKAAVADNPLAGVSLGVLLGERDGAPVFLGGTRDAGSLLEHISRWSDATAEAGSTTRELRAALGQAVIANITAERYGPAALGVSLFLPQTVEEYDHRASALEALGAPSLRPLYVATPNAR